MTQNDLTNQSRSSVKKRWSNRSWHRRASKPVTIWMIIFVIAGLTHILIPNYRLVLIHIFTLGVVTNSIVLWSQHLTEKHLEQRLDDSARPIQLARVWVLQAGIVATLIGHVLDGVVDFHWIIISLGAVLIAAVLLLHGFSLAKQWSSAPKDKSFKVAVIGYILACLCLPIGALFGALMAAGVSEDLHNRLLAAHMFINIGGFVGLSAASSLIVLFPAIWKTISQNIHSATMLGLITAGVAIAAIGCLLDQSFVTGAGLLVFILGWIVGLISWLGIVVEALQLNPQPINYPAVSILMAVVWLIGTVAVLASRVFSSDTISDVVLPSTTLLVGFGGQLLIGVMSYLLPTTMGGGEKAIAAGAREMNRGGLFRSGLINMGLLFWRIGDYSWLKVVMSLLSIGALVFFIPLMIRAVRAQRSVIMENVRRKEQGEDPAPSTPTTTGPGWNQLTAAIAVMALILALFGGLHGPSAAPTAVQATGSEDISEIEVTTQGMKFVPDVIEVPRGNQVIIKYKNTDSTDHDLRFENGLDTGRIRPGKSAELDLGVLNENLEGWCTIAGHRSQGMTITIVVTD